MDGAVPDESADAVSDETEVVVTDETDDDAATLEGETEAAEAAEAAEGVSKSTSAISEHTTPFIPLWYVYWSVWIDLTAILLAMRSHDGVNVDDERKATCAPSIQRVGALAIEIISRQRRRRNWLRWRRGRWIR